MFDTRTGVSSLVLKEIPYRQIAYITVRSVLPGGLREHLEECVSFSRMCGAERIYATGHPELEAWPEHCAVLVMEREGDDWQTDVRRVPVTEDSVGRWREIYNEKMASVDNAATMTARDEKRILGSGGAVFLYEGDALLGIGWMEAGELLALAAVVKGAGERVLKGLLHGRGEPVIRLEVASTNRRAIRLYERMGFVTVEERSKWYTIRQEE